jgi:hypothetical protein
MYGVRYAWSSRCFLTLKQPGLLSNRLIFYDLYILLLHWFLLTLIYDIWLDKLLFFPFNFFLLDLRWHIRNYIGGLEKYLLVILIIIVLLRWYHWQQRYGFWIFSLLYFHLELLLPLFDIFPPEFFLLFRFDILMEVLFNLDIYFWILNRIFVLDLNWLYLSICYFDYFLLTNLLGSLILNWWYHHINILLNNSISFDAFSFNCGR